MTVAPPPSPEAGREDDAAELIADNCCRLPYWRVKGIALSAAAERDELRAEVERLERYKQNAERERERWYKLYDDVRHVKYIHDSCKDGLVENLEAYADEIDCGPSCEVSYTERDTNTHVCHLSDKGECPAVKALDIREVARVLRTLRPASEAQRARLAGPMPEQRVSDEDMRMLERLLTGPLEDWDTTAKECRRQMLDYIFDLRDLRVAWPSVPASTSEYNVGCPVCGGDCSSANPPVIGCPILDASPEPDSVKGWEVTAKIVEAVMRAFQPTSSVLRYRESEGWHTCDIVAMRHALKAAFALLPSRASIEAGAYEKAAEHLEKIAIVYRAGKYLGHERARELERYAGDIRELKLDAAS